MNSRKIIFAAYGLWLCLIVFGMTACTSSATAWRPKDKRIVMQRDEAKAPPSVTRIGGAPFQEDLSFANLQFINEREGWLAGDTQLWRTRNGGEDWKLIFVSKTAIDRIYEIELINSQLGWILGEDKIYKTVDGGDTWTQLARPFSDGRVLAFKFLEDGERGWAAGDTQHPSSLKRPYSFFSDRYNSPGSKEGYYQYVSYTKDGGKTWQLLPFPSRTGINIWYWLDEEHIWAIADDIFYWKEGRWDKINYSEARCDNREFLKNLKAEHAWPYGPVAAYFLNDTEGWISYSNGYIAKTTDGGQSWCDLLNPQTIWPTEGLFAYFKKLYFANSINGWALDADGTIYETKDGGKTWAKINIDLKFNDLYFLDANHGWAISKEGLFRINP